MEPNGIYAILKALPIWLIMLILNFLCVDILYIGREKIEGLPYNIAWSSQYGDRALVGCIIIGILVLQRGKFLFPA